MPIQMLFNTTITISSATRIETKKQPVETIGSAGSTVDARIEHIEDIPIDFGGGLQVQQLYLFYVTADTTVKEQDIITCGSVEYRVLSVKDAYGMGAALDHKEVSAVKVK